MAATLRSEIGPRPSRFMEHSNQAPIHRRIPILTNEVQALYWPLSNRATGRPTGSEPRPRAILDPGN